MTERLRVPSEWASELCKALGEDPDKVRSIDMHLESGKSVVFSIQKLLPPENGARLIQTIKKVSWVEEIEGYITEGENNG
jgi:hypothetical protein